MPGFVEVTDTRIWVRNVYTGVYFNNFIKSENAQDKKKIIISNSMTGSSRRFKRFERLCFNVDSDLVKKIGN